MLEQHHPNAGPQHVQPIWGDAIVGHGIEPQMATPAPGPGMMHAQIPRPIFEAHVPNTRTISNAAIFAQQVYLAASRVLTGASTSRPIQPTEANEAHLPAYLVNEIASTAVEVIGSLAGLNTYIYGSVGDLNSPLHRDLA